MTSRNTKLLIVFLVLLFIGAGIYLAVTTNEEMGGPIENVGRTGDEPIEVQDDERNLPEYDRDSLETIEPVE